MLTIDAILSHPNLKESGNMNRKYIQSEYDKYVGVEEYFCIFYMYTKNTSFVMDAQWFNKDGEPVERKEAVASREAIEEPQKKGAEAP